MDEGLPFAQWVLRRRIRAGLTQTQLADRAGLSLRAVRNAELGNVRNPRPETERRLREALGPPEPVRIEVLGPLTVRRGDAPVEIGAEKQQLLLALLALQPNQVVRREDIIDVIWGDDPPQSCLDLVNTYIARLRRTLEPDRDAGEPARMIVTAKTGYRLAVDDDQLDLLRFETTVARAEQAADPAATERGYVTALRLWRGPALAGVDRYRQHPLRLALAMRYATVVLAYADVALARGNPGDAMTWLRTLIAQEPLHEAAHARLMLALAASGRQAAALKLFDDISGRLAGELGIDPGAELRAAQVQVLRQDFPAPAGNRPAQLPADVGGFRGRESQLAELDDLVAHDDTGARIAVLSGTAGVGKTAIAVHWAQRHRTEFPDGQLYLDLRGYGTERPVEPGDALSGFLRALGVDGADIPAEPDERAAKFRTVLAARRMVLVLDNVGSVGQVRPLLPGTPSCFVLVTSRDALPGLVARHGARRLFVDLLTPGEAHDLLRTLVGERVDHEPEAAAGLIGYSARLPLALRLVAELALARPSETLAALGGELADERRRLDLLDGGGDPLTAVRAVFSWSYRHLPADAARVFRLWGLHPGLDFTHAATAALTGHDRTETERLTRALARAHLVQETSPGRFQLHDLLRVYATELAGEGQPDARAALVRLFDFYVRSAGQAMDLVIPQEKHLRPSVPEPAEPVGDAPLWLEAERRNLLAVAAHATRHGWPEHLRLLSGILWHYLDVGGYHEDSLVLHSHASALAHDSGDRAGEADPLTLIGLGHWRVGRSREALRYLEEALAIVRETGNHGTEIHVLNTLGLVCRALGRFGEAIAYSTEALALARKTGDRAGEGLVLVVLGCACRGIGRFGEAVAHLEAALELAVETSDRTSQGYALVNLGDALSALGRHEEAVRSLEAGLDHFRAVGVRVSEGYALGILGNVERALGRYDSAAGHLERALEISDETGSRTNRSVALKNLGDVHRAEQRYRDAAQCLDEALAIARECGDRGVETRVLNGLGALACARGALNEAVEYHRDALAVSGETGCTAEEALAHRGLGDAYRELGDAGAAREHWERALSRYTAMSVPEAVLVRARLDALGIVDLPSRARG